MKYTILENGNYLVELTDMDGFPMFIEMSESKFIEMQGAAE